MKTPVAADLEIRLVGGDLEGMKLSIFGELVGGGGGGGFRGKVGKGVDGVSSVLPQSFRYLKTDQLVITQVGDELYDNVGNPGSMNMRFTVEEQFFNMGL